MLVQIDLDSIRDNPRGGQQVWTEPVGQPYTTVVVITELSHGWKRDVHIEYPNGTCHQLPDQCLTVTRSDKQLPRPEGWVDSRTPHQPTRTVQSLRPQPAYLFSYEDPTITCQQCGAEFPVSQLQSDSFDDGNGDICTNKMCPKCGTWEAIDDLSLTYESIGDALKRRGANSITA